MITVRLKNKIQLRESAKTGTTMHKEIIKHNRFKSDDGSDLSNDVEM